MRIAQINLGAIEIPPKGWGAIEKVIWNYKLQLEKLGHTVDVVFPNETIDGNGQQKYDIVHYHAANQCLENWCDFNSPYIFSLHDHHVVKYGKLSPLFYQNLSAIKQSVASITYAEFLVDYFDTTDKLFYIPHGVDNSIYHYKNNPINGHKLLCVANNGYADDQSYDRKGFRYSIEAAMKLNLDITIVGPENNNKFFDRNPDLLGYSKLKRIISPTETELVNIYNEHTIFLHPSELEAGHPNLTLLEAMACGLPIVGTFDGKTELPGLIKCTRDTNSVKENIEKVMRNYDSYKSQALDTAKKYDWENIVKQLESFYKSVISIRDNFTNEDMKNHVLHAYESTEIMKTQNRDPKISYNINFNDGPFFEMICPIKKNITVNFINKDNNEHISRFELESNRWYKPGIKYYKNWEIKVSGDDEKTFNIDLKGKNVLIDFHSSSLGDTIAWAPYAEEFRKKHNCIVYCSTDLKNLFEKEYTEIKFIKPGSVISELYATYRLGWFSPPWGGSRTEHPNDYRIVPLQQTATDILGLPYREIVPKITVPNGERPIKERYVVIAEHSTANAKHWHYPNGWQIIVDKLNMLGFKVMTISKQGSVLRNTINECGDFPLEKRINQIKHAEFMITIGSGLAWVAWALGKKVVMISGFSKSFCEFKSNNIRIINENVCNGCFNDLRYEFDRGKWDWCPAQENTPRMFECTKTITPDMIMDAIKNNNLI